MTDRFTRAVRASRDYERYLLRRLGRRYATVGVHGQRMTLNLADLIISDWLFIRRTWEPYETDLLRRVLQKGMTVLDIGAHIGYYSLLAARCVGPQGAVWAFEPAPENYRLLVRNVRQNRLWHMVHTANCAVSDRAGDATLYLSDTNNGDNRVFASTRDDDALFNGGRARQTVTVPTVSLDAYLAQQDAGPIHVIKMDVQGAELSALRGMQATLRANADIVLFMEYWPHGLQLGGNNPRHLIEFVTDEMGLSLILIIPEARHVLPLSVYELLAHRFDPTRQVDLVCTRNVAALLKTLRAV